MKKKLKKFYNSLFRKKKQPKLEQTNICYNCGAVKKDYLCDRCGL